MNGVLSLACFKTYCAHLCISSLCLFWFFHSYTPSHTYTQIFTRTHSYLKIWAAVIWTPWLSAPYLAGCPGDTAITPYHRPSCLHIHTLLLLLPLKKPILPLTNFQPSGSHIITHLSAGSRVWQQSHSRLLDSQLTVAHFAPPLTIIVCLLNLYLCSGYHLSVYLSCSLSVCLTSCSSVFSGGRRCCSGTERRKGRACRYWAGGLETILRNLHHQYLQTGIFAPDVAICDAEMYLCFWRLFIFP